MPKALELSPEDIQAIRDSPDTQVEVARVFGISQPTVSRIRRGERHV